ncbi:MAG: hypothetical protein HKP35_07390, partial [Silicimonas sp.]|nr:hypothetical protein [Silicimonas sp.]
KVLIQLASTGLLASVLVLHFAVWRRWSVWPLLAAFASHHMAFAYGFENYVLAMPPVLLVLAVWFTMAGCGPVARLLAMVPLAGAVYVLHVYAFAFLFGAIALLEAGFWWRGRGRVSGFPLHAVLVACVAIGPALHLFVVAAGTAGIEPGATEMGGMLRRLTVALSPFTALGQPYLDPGVLRVAALQIVAMAMIWGIARARFGVAIRDGTAIALWGLLAVSLVVPANFAGVALTDIRFPALVVCLLVAFSDVRLSRACAVVLAVAVVAAALGRTVWLESRWAQHDGEVRELLAAGAVLTPDDRMLVARTGLGWDVLLHSHSAAHLAREVGLFIPDIFSGGNALTATGAYAARDAFQPYPLEVARLIAEAEAPRRDGRDVMRWQERYWADWPAFYTHVLVLRAPGRPVPDTPELGEVVAIGSFFAIYETGSVAN